MKKKIKKLIVKKALEHRYNFDCDPFLEEVIINSEEVYDSFIAAGKSSKEAYQLTLNQIGDLDEYFNDKSIDDSDSITRQRVVHNFLSVLMIIVAVLLVSLYYIIEKRPIWMYLVLNYLIIGVILIKKTKINNRFLVHQILKNNIDRKFYFCLVSNFLIFLPTLTQFDFNQYLMFSGISIFLINLTYVLIVDKEINPNFLLAIIALTFSIIHLSYSVYSITLIFFMAVLFFTGVLYIKSVINHDFYDYLFIFIGITFIILMLFFMDLLNQFEIIFILLLLIAILYFSFNKKFSPEKKLNKIKSLISLFIVIHILAINIFLLAYYLINFRIPEFVPYRYASLLYRPTILCILLEYLNNFIYYLVIKYFYRKKGVQS